MKEWVHLTTNRPQLQHCLFQSPWVLVTFLIVVTKSDKKNFRKDRCRWLTAREQSPLWGRKREANSNIFGTCSSPTFAVWSTCALSLPYVWDTVSLMTWCISRLGLLPLVKPFWQHPYRHSQMFISWVILNPLNLAIKTSYCLYS